MIAKLIAHGATRDEAFDRLAAALAETEVVGVTTNLPFLRWLVSHPAVRAGETTTAFLTEYPPLSAPPRALPDASGAAASGSTCHRPRSAPRPTSTRSSVDHVGPGADGPRTVVAPMPGTVISVNVHEGSTVKAGEPLVVLEAMKMETPLTLTVRRDRSRRARPGR